MKKENSILQLFPSNLRPHFETVAKQHENLSEIRIRAGRPVVIRRRGKEYYLTTGGEEKETSRNEWKNALFIDAKQVDQMFSYLCQYSPYAYGEAIKQGFLTVAGGHRIGVAGQIVRTSDGVGGMRNIRFINIRISHEIKGVAAKYIPFLYNHATKKIENCLIVAPPGCGKTTMLRDMVRRISDGDSDRQGCGVAVVDERSEIAGCFMGEPQNDVGVRTDVLDACPKDVGMEMMLRAMSPEVLAIDEIATKKDVETLLLLLHCGVNILATVHGDSVKEIRKKEYLKPLFSSVYFKRFLVIGADQSARLYDENGEVLV